MGRFLSRTPSDRTASVATASTRTRAPPPIAPRMSSPSAATEGADAERGEDASRNDDANSEARYARLVFFVVVAFKRRARRAQRLDEWFLHRVGDSAP